MHRLYELKEKLIDELEGYADHGKYSKEDVEVIKYMASAIDHICNIVDSTDDEYSNAMYRGSYGRGSYARGRRGAVRRDAMGRYSREGGYSRGTDDMVMELHEIMSDTDDPMLRSEIERLIHKVEKMK